jgi:excisionase family DNA binding protein
MMMTDEDKLLTAKEVAAWLQLNERTVLNMVERQELPALRFGRQWRFSKDDIVRTLRQGPQPAHEEASS